jgi:glucose/arabinose dehydrogenase
MDFAPASRYPGWDGDLIVGALKFMLLSHIDLDGDTFVAENRFFEGIGRVREVEVGPDGYLYVLTEAPGALYRLWPASE